MMQLVKYELKELRHRKIIIVTLVLFVFGIQQVVWGNKIGGEFHIDLVTYLKNAWLPINLIYVPLLLIFSDIFTSRFSVIEALPVSKTEIILSKIFSCYIVGGVFYILSLIILILIIILNGLEPSYYLPYILLFSMNFMLSLTFIVGGSLCISRFCKEKFTRYFISLVLFLLICNFYKEMVMIFPIFYVDMLSSTFELISMNRVFINHIIILAIINVILFLTYFIKGKNKTKTITVLGVLIGVIAILIFNTRSYLPREYSIKEDIISENYIENKYDDGYLIEKYEMNIDLYEKFSNECTMDIKVKEDSEITLYLFEGLDISKVTINGKDASYERDFEKLIVKLDGYKNENIKLSVKYGGIINTTDLQGSKKYFVNNTSGFLGDFFEWYPKSLNRGNIKEYKIKINTNGENSLYTNLDRDINGIYYGLSKEVFILNGSVCETEYKGIKFVGNLEQINSEKKLSALYKIVDGWCNNTLNEKSRVILTPKTDKQYLISDIYGDTMLFGEFDRE
ncbi:MAG: hypothetical protein ACRC7N_17390 [Clostridium sp.]